MKDRLFYVPIATPALHHAVTELEKLGMDFADSPNDQVTHLLLPVPCRLSDEAVADIVRRLPRDITVMGGFIERPQLPEIQFIDLLKDDQYQAENAMITAYCAINLASPQMTVVWQDCPVLVLGWGRIGKCLASLLKALGAQVSVAARKEADRAMITALGYHGRGFGEPDCSFCRYRVIFNTVPHPILTREQTAHCRPSCLKVELASTPGIAGLDVIDGRGLPSKLAPESSGKLIARTVLRLCARKEEPL